jgi:hypothetical protein
MSLAERSRHLSGSLKAKGKRVEVIENFPFRMLRSNPNVFSNHPERKSEKFLGATGRKLRVSVEIQGCVENDSGDMERLHQPQQIASLQTQ